MITSDLDEIMLVDKPAGVSSFAVVARIRRELSDQAGLVEIKGKDGAVRQKRKRVKVGHAGTLDPFATGLLIILAGKATKRAGDFLKLDKEYEATIELGKVSTTGDVEGEISETGSGKVSTLAEVEEVLQRFQGKIRQRVPNYSAVKINGQRAYKIAREGKLVEMPVREVQIYELELLHYEWPFLRIRCRVSSGTYIRALGEDIGTALGVGGYLTALRRTKIDHYDVKEARKIEI